MEIATQAVQSAVQKVATEAPKNAPGVAGGGSDFAKLLNQRLEQPNRVNDQILQSFGVSPEKQMKAISAEGLEIKPESIKQGQEIRSNGKVLDLLTDVNRGALHLESISEMATSGQKFTPAELLGMQAGVAQITLSIELTGKCFEQINTGTKQLLQTSFT